MSFAAHIWCSSGGRPYEAYLGIPYADPPVGNLRFSPPRKYSGKAKEAPSDYGPEALQVDVITRYDEQV